MNTNDAVFQSIALDIYNGLIARTFPIVTQVDANQVTGVLHSLAQISVASAPLFYQAWNTYLSGTQGYQGQTGVAAQTMSNVRRTG